MTELKDGGRPDSQTKLPASPKIKNKKSIFPVFEGNCMQKSCKKSNSTPCFQQRLIVLSGKNKMMPKACGYLQCNLAARGNYV
jgi:hypothetical protein